MNVLVDSSAWVVYFRGTGDVQTLDWLISEGLVVTNDIILAELTPALLVRGERKVVMDVRVGLSSPVLPRSGCA